MLKEAPDYIGQISGTETWMVSSGKDCEDKVCEDALGIMPTGCCFRTGWISGKKLRPILMLTAIILLATLLTRYVTICVCFKA